MIDNPISKSTQQRRPTLKWAVGVDTIIGYILVPFYVVLSFVIPKRNTEAISKKPHTSSAGEKIIGGFKSICFAWIKSIGVAMSTGAIVGTVEWGLARLLNRRMLDGVPAIATGVGIPALVGGVLIDRKNRWRGAAISVLATLPRIRLSGSWRRDLSTDEEYDQKMAKASGQLSQVLKEEAERKQRRIANLRSRSTST